MKNIRLINEDEISSISFHKMEPNDAYVPIPDKLVGMKLFGIFPYGPKHIKVEEHFKIGRYKYTKEDILENNSLMIQDFPLMVFRRPYIEITLKHKNPITIKFNSNESAIEYLEQLKSELKNINLINIQ